MPRMLLLLIVFLYCLIAEAAAGQVSEPILVGYGRDPKWSPGETSISLIRNDTLYGTTLDSAHQTHAIHSGPIFKYEWLDDSTLVTQERRYFDTKDGKRKVEKILRVSLSGKVVEAANDSSSLLSPEGRRLGLMKFSDGSLGYSDYARGEEEIVKLSAKAIPDTSLYQSSVSLFVDTKPEVWGKVWLYYGDKDHGRQVTLSENIYLLPQLAPSRDKILCSAPRGDLVVFDTLGNELANLGRVSMPSWDPSGQYITYCNAVFSEFDIEKSDIFVSKYDGSETTQLTATPDVIEYQPAFSPSSRYIIYSNERTGAIYAQRVR